MRRAPGHVTLVEHGLMPQTRAGALAPELRIILAERLVAAGLRDLVVSGADDLAGLPRQPDLRYGVRLDDPAALERILDARPTDLTVTAAGDAASARRLHGGDVEDGLRRLEPAARLSAEHGIRLRGRCPDVLAGDDGRPLPPALAAALCAEMVNLGCFEISLGDDAGAGDPTTWRAVWEECAARVGADRLAVQLHAAASDPLICLDTLLPLGLQTLDTSMSADAMPTTGDIARHLHRRGVATGLDEQRLADAVHWLEGATSAHHRDAGAV
jgi:hydroxymethylglutaryl-CoA lyase